MADFGMQGSGQRRGWDPVGDGKFVPYVTIYGTGGSSMNTGQVTCASAVAATQIVAANPSRISITLSNNENGVTWISSTSASAAASSTGYRMIGGNVAFTLHTQSAIFGLASSGTTAKTTYVEEAL